MMTTSAILVAPVLGWGTVLAVRKAPQPLRWQGNRDIFQPWQVTIEQCLRRFLDAANNRV